MKQFPPLTRSQPQSSKFIGLGSSQFAQKTIDKYNFFKTSHFPRFSLIFWKPQNQLTWKTIQNLINLNPYFSVKLALIEQKKQQIRDHVNNELITQVLSPNFTNLIYGQVWQWFNSSCQEKISQLFVHSYLKPTQFNTFSSTLTKIDRNFSVTLTVNSQKVNQEQRSRSVRSAESQQTLDNSAMTFLINNNVWQKPAKLALNSINLIKEVSNLSQQQLNTRSPQSRESSLRSTESKFPLLTQNKLLLSDRISYQQNTSLTHRDPQAIRSLPSTTSNNQYQENRTTPFLELATQQTTIRPAAPPSFDNPSLALPYYRASAPVTQELSKVKTQLATLQANTEQLSLQAIAAKSISTPLPTEEVNRLSEQVYQAIERKIRIEQERRGR